MKSAAGAPDHVRVLTEGGGPVHFMGIGGAGMRGLAEALARAGRAVTGCDASPPEAVEALTALGVAIDHGHDPAHVTGASAVVRTSAVPEDHPELVRARELGLPVLKRAEALGAWVRGGVVMAVAGTHGKTSTTTMLTEVLATAGLDPTGFVGGHVSSWGGNLRSGGDRHFVVEADEYDRSFLHLDPTIAVVTNVEADHLDIYGDFEGVVAGFRAFVGRIVSGGALVACADDHGASRLLFGHDVHVVTYGTTAGSMVRATDVGHADDGGSSFRVVEEGEDRGTFSLPVPGLHNVRNALGAASAARRIGVSWEDIREGLARYRGVGRRFQRLGEVGGVTVVDDYAHHPTEVRATLDAARRAYPRRRVIAAFQPHLYTRTREFHDAFGRELAAADAVWVTDVYPAREEPIEGVTGELVALAAERVGDGPVRYHADVETLHRAVADELRHGDVCLTMGAGSIEHVGPRLLHVLGEAK